MNTAMVSEGVIRVFHTDLASHGGIGCTSSANNSCLVMRTNKSIIDGIVRKTGSDSLRRYLTLR
jgi:hypothetical protein